MNLLCCNFCGLEEKTRGGRLKPYEHCEKCRLVLYCSDACMECDSLRRKDKCPFPFPTKSGEPRQQQDKLQSNDASFSKLCEKLKRVKIDDDQPHTDSSDSDFVAKPKVKTKRKLKKSVIANGFETDSS